MAFKIRELIIDIGLAFDSRRLTLFGRYMDRAKNKMDLARKAALGVAAAIAVVTGAVTGAILTTAQYSEEVFRNAAAFQAPIEKFQAYQFALERLGGSTDDFIDMLGTLVDRAKDAAEGSKEYAKEFKRVGIAVSELKKKKPIEILDLYLDRAQKVKDKTDAIASAVRLFGDDLGRRVLPAIVGGATSFKHLAEVARNTGYVLKKHQIENLRKLNKSMTLAKLIVTGFGRYLAAQLSPSMSRLADRMNKVVLHSAAWIRTKIDAFAKNFAIRLEKAWLAAKDLFAIAQRFGGVVKIFKAFAAVLLVIATAHMGKQFYLIAKSLYALRKASIAAMVPSLILFAKFFLIGAAVALVVAVLEDMWVALKGGESVIGKFAKKSEFFAGIMELFKAVVGAVKRAMDDMIPVFNAATGTTSTLQDVLGAVMTVFLALAAIIGITIVAAVYLLIRAFQGLVVIGSFLGELFAVVFLGILSAVDFLNSNIINLQNLMRDFFDEVLQGAKESYKAFLKFGNALGNIPKKIRQSFMTEEQIRQDNAKDRERQLAQEKAGFGGSSLDITGRRAMSELSDPRIGFVQRYAREERAAAPPAVREGDINVTVQGTGDPYADTRKGIAAAKQAQRTAQQRFAVGAR